MIPFIPALSFPININFGGRKKGKEEKSEDLTIPSAPIAAINQGCDVCLDMDQLLMAGVVVSILILSTAVVIYTARRTGDLHVHL